MRSKRNQVSRKLSKMCLKNEEWFQVICNTYLHVRLKKSFKLKSWLTLNLLRKIMSQVRQTRKTKMKIAKFRNRLLTKTGILLNFHKRQCNCTISSPKTTSLRLWIKGSKKRVACMVRAHSLWVTKFWSFGPTQRSVKSTQCLKTTRFRPTTNASKKKLCSWLNRIKFKKRRKKRSS